MKLDETVKAIKPFAGTEELSELQNLLNLGNEIMLMKSSVKRLQLTSLRASALGNTLSKNERGASQEELDMVAGIVTDKPFAKSVSAEALDLVKNADETMKKLAKEGIEKALDFCQRYASYNEALDKSYASRLDNTKLTNFVDTYPVFVKDEEGNIVEFNEENGCKSLNTCRKECADAIHAFGEHISEFALESAKVSDEEKPSYFTAKVDRLYNEAIALLQYKMYLYNKLA